MRTSIERYYNRLFFLILILAFTSVNLWSSFPILNTQAERIIQYLVLLHICIIISKNKCLYYKKYNVIIWFSIWVIISIIRGIFKADCYWEYNQLTIGTMCLSLPLLVLVFDNPKSLTELNKYWIKLCIPAFFLFIYWVAGATQFYLSPIFFFACFISLLPPKWRLIICILLAMMGLYLSNRSQVIKVIICISFSIIYYYKKFFSTFFLKLLHLLFFVIPIILLYLGISGKYNLFSEGLANNKNQLKTIKSDGSEENLNTDTRTFIYKEVIESAIKNDYVIIGRTPALGNDSYYFEKDYNAKYKKDIRYMNELCHTNIFTWLGLIGVILYSLIYLKASYLALYYSNSFALKLLGCYIAFHWMFGWIENMNRFDISNIAFWSIVGLCFSNKFRNMTDKEFILWFKNIFK